MEIAYKKKKMALLSNQKYALKRSSSNSLASLATSNSLTTVASEATGSGSVMSPVPIYGLSPVQSDNEGGEGGGGVCGYSSSSSSDGRGEGGSRERERGRRLSASGQSIVHRRRVSREGSPKTAESSPGTGDWPAVVLACSLSPTPSYSSATPSSVVRIRIYTYIQYTHYVHLIPLYPLYPQSTHYIPI